MQTFPRECVYVVSIFYNVGILKYCVLPRKVLICPRMHSPVDRKTGIHEINGGYHVFSFERKHTKTLIHNCAAEK